MGETKPAGWTLNKAKLKERGWTPADIANRLGEGHTIAWNGMSMSVWAMDEIETAEATDPAFAARVAEVAERISSRATAKAVRAKESEAKEDRDRLMGSWARDLPDCLAELERTRLDLRYLLDCYRQKFDITKHQPATSTHYFPELASSNGSLGGGKPQPFLPDESKLFHVFSEGWAKGCKYRVSWRTKDGPKAVAILCHVGISFSETLLEDSSGRETGFGSRRDSRGNADRFTIRVEPASGRKLVNYGDCCKEMVLD